MCKCSRIVQEHELSCLSLLTEETANDKKCILYLDDAEETKKEIKGKRCVIDEDVSDIANMFSLLEDNDEWGFTKKEDPFVINLDKNKKTKE